MNWGSASEFFAMGGRGGFVWGSFAVTALVIAVELWVLRRARRTWLARMSRRATSIRSKK